MRIGWTIGWLICLWKANTCEAFARFGSLHRLLFRGGTLDGDKALNYSNAAVTNDTSIMLDETGLPDDATASEEKDLTHSIESGNRPAPKSATSPLRQSLRHLPNDFLQAWHRQLPRPLRFFISGRFGDIIFFYCEKYLSKAISVILKSPSPLLPQSLLRVLESSHDSISFLIGFLLHILPQHWVHACLVYGLDTINTRQKYRDSLLGMYKVCLTGAVGSTILNTVLLKLTPASKSTAFVLTLATFSVINYFWIGWVVKRTTQKESSHYMP